MGALATREPGVLLAGVFDLGKKGVKAEMADFEKRLAALQAKLGVEEYVSATRRDGKKLMVKILAASSGPPKGKAAAARDPKAPGKARKDAPADWGRKKR